ncbi:MFS transporter [Paenibacillus sp. 481]|uniref:MFS transporter n=1 Tax=Paenibacillus sp. 481 TaxID=2835869 RepID=UPI001E4550A1|nr:MFS transporter [Paenibacillus sp. 481]UHA75553.1 MFS transporter [Paenibacillus sp. 481]
MRAFIYVIIIICFMDMFVQLPVIGTFAQGLGASSLGIGLAIGMYSLTNMFGNIAAGRWIDKFGGKRVLLSGFILTVGVLLLYPFVQTPEQLIGLRFIHGLTGGLLVPSAFMLASQNAGSHNQGKTMALSGAAVGLAAIIGPATGGILKAKVGMDTLFYMVAGLLAIGALLTMLLPRSSKAKQGDAAPLADRAGIAESTNAVELAEIAVSAADAASGTQRKQTIGFRELFTLKPVAQSYACAFALMFAMGSLTFALPLKADGLSFPAQTSGMLLSTFGIVAILMFLLPTNRLYDRVNPLRLMLVGGLVVTMALLLLSLFEHKTMMYAAMGLYGLGYALLFPSMNALLTRHVDEANRGKAFGIFYAFYSLGVVAGSSGIGAVTGDYDIAMRIGAAFMFIVMVLLFIWSRMGVSAKTTTEQASM